jgi:hypothetical protein
MDFQALFDKEILKDVSHDVEYEVRIFVKTVGEQLTNSTHSQRSPYQDPNFYFTTAFYTKAQEFGLTEADAIEVYNTGQEINEAMIVRDYNGYEAGIEYTTELYTGKPLITSIWKREF